MLEKEKNAVQIEDANIQLDNHTAVSLKQVLSSC